ncbi:L,D-transpeptidase family protein [Spongiibacter sp. KMU-166]|uniref:L,D-transpeptidase family protein n=2 Tax=Spongiibacter thalassae TaxID=2721624 RepID=A0ABX1GBL5_9GAMM|nr:L,D-transpeptidase family protein [Spongiibacter thalassae]
MFPNKHAVYIHDTPSRELFQKTLLDFSSGCIRVERPRKPAEWVLANTIDWPPPACNRLWTRESSEGVMSRRQYRYILFILPFWTRATTRH